jgi:hypothetical protein
MKQDVRAAFDWLYKPIAFGAVKPFDVTGKADEVQPIKRGRKASR